MRLLRLSIINFKRQIKNPLILIMSIVFPLIMLVMMFGSNGNIDRQNTIGIIDNSKTKLSQELIKNLELSNHVEIYKGSIESEKRNIEEGNVDAIYVIEKGFDEDIKKEVVPEVQLYKLGDENAVYKPTTAIDTFIKDKILEVKGIDLAENNVITKIESEKDTGKSVMIITFISYFMIIGGSYIATEMITLKNQKVLKRTISTANTDREILGSLFISCCMTQITLSLITFFIALKVLNLQDITIGLGVLTIVLSSFVGTAFISVIVRWIKNPTIAELLIVGISLVAYIMGTLTAGSDMIELPSVIYKIGELSPFTWIARIPNTGEVMLPIIILCLMAAVLFTLGSFRLKDFARE